MAEVDEDEFFDRLKGMAAEKSLIRVMEGPNIDIIIHKDETDYDYWDMVGTVFLDTDSTEELERQRDMYIKRLEEAGVRDGGSYEME